MHSPKTTITFAALCTLLLSAPLSGQVSYRIDGDDTGPVHVALGEDALLELFGPPSAPVALYVGIEATSIPTPFGIIGVDPFVPSSFFVLNGFAYPGPSHSLSATPSGGTLSILRMPFASGPVGQRCWSQAIIEDPAQPAGYATTQTIEAEAVSPPPQITQIVPNVIAPGFPLTIYGKHFEWAPTDNVVMLGDVQCSVAVAAPNQLVITVPAGSRSGPISITTRNGTVGGNRGAISTWLTITDTPRPESAVKGITQAGPQVAVVGSINIPSDVDRYFITVQAGEEIYAEAYSYDPLAQRVTEGTNSTNVRFDPLLRVRRDNLVYSYDNDSGPERASGIGVYRGPTWLQADVTATYEIEVSSFASITSGNYLLIFGTRSAAPDQPLSIQMVAPNMTSPGSYATIFGSGIFAADGLGAYGVTVDGLAATPVGIQDGRLSFQIPANARSGQVQLIKGAEATSYSLNRMESWITLIEGTLFLEATAANMTLPSSVAVMGATDPANPTDSYTFFARAGHQYRVEVNAINPLTTQLTTGLFTQPTPIDTELTLNREAGGLAIMNDGGGGPAANAMFGGTITPTFQPSEDGNYVITVRSYFGFSTGSYLLNIVEI